MLQVKRPTALLHPARQPPRRTACRRRRGQTCSATSRTRRECQADFPATCKPVCPQQGWATAAGRRLEGRRCGGPEGELARARQFHTCAGGLLLQPSRFGFAAAPC